MSLTLTEKSQGTFELAPAGTSVARCYRLVDMGTHKITWQGKEKTARKLLISFELLDDDNRMSDGRPFSVSKRFTASLNEKAALRAFLESWRGKAYTAADLEGVDLRKVLGAYCLLGIVHAEKDGSTYANISSVLPLPKAMPKPAPVNDILVFDFDDPQADVVYATLSESLQKQIADSPEWKARTAKPAPAEKPADDGAQPSGFQSMDDDIPW